MRILAVINGEYGARHVANVRAHAPTDWYLATWQAPTRFPLVIDEPQDFLPVEIPQVDLILSFAEHKGVAELLPDLAKLTGAQAVIAGVDSEAWLPRGLARQLRAWLEKIGVACATPKPLCSLTEQDYSVTRRQRITYKNPLISQFARLFGRPSLSLRIDQHSKIIVAAEIQRDAVCGCARFVADGLVGLHVDEAEEQAGLLHHHFPCLASMGVDIDFDDTLMHVSGNILKDEVRAQIKPYKQVTYWRPGQLSE